MFHPDPIAPARRQVRLDPGRTFAPRSPTDADQRPAVTHWQALRNAGLIADRNPAAPPAVVAVRDANDALFRAIAADRRRAGAGRAG